MSSYTHFTEEEKNHQDRLNGDMESGLELEYAFDLEDERAD